jgi:hypothetical protein
MTLGSWDTVWNRCPFVVIVETREVVVTLLVVGKSRRRPCRCCSALTMVSPIVVFITGNDERGLVGGGECHGRGFLL